jgi:hypothetical protein
MHKERKRVIIMAAVRDVSIGIRRSVRAVHAADDRNEASETRVKQSGLSQEREDVERERKARDPNESVR